MDAVLAMDLRARGFHFYDCVLAPYNPARGILWNIKNPFYKVEPRGTLILANPNGMAEEYDEKHEADSTISSLEHGESGSESGNEASDRDTASEDANVQGVQDPVSDVMLARHRRHHAIRCNLLKPY